VNLIGTEYEGDLIVPGWESQGGGLMTDPIWYHTFKRADEARLVLIQWALPRRPGSSHTPFRVTDVLLIQPIARDLVLTFDCDPPRTNLSERIFAVVRLDVRQRWWLDVRKAWKVEVATGTISPAPTKGVACLNEGVGAE
jgi:hypothetical protein